MSLLEVQQLLLHLDPMAKPSQASVTLNDPVTGKDNRNRVGPVGIPHGPKGLRMADGLCYFLIGFCFPIRDLCQCRPHFLLERRSPKVQGTIKPLQLPLEIVSTEKAPSVLTIILNDLAREKTL